MSDLAREAAGPPLHLVINCASGAGLGERLAEFARDRCQEAGRALTIHMPSQPGELDRLGQQIRVTAEATGATVIAAGGDGTVRTLAKALLGSTIPLGVIPLGTFNFFARNYGIPEDFDEALRIIFDGSVRHVQLGQVNDELFLINASLGLYSDLIKVRESHVSRFGRNRLVATASTVFSLARGYPSLDLELTTGDSRERLRSPMIFIGNNALQLRSVSLDVARCARQGQLAVVIMQPLDRVGMLRLALYGLTRRLQREESLRSFCADSLAIATRKQSVEVVMDGECLRLTTPLQFRILRNAVALVMPEGARADA